ncbi:MAG: two-component regulator propeller domain-containing protein [Prevotella sp.]
MNYEILKSYKTTAIVIALLTVMTSWANKPDLKFMRLDTRNGLSNSQVNCVLKDSKGFVWIGTKYGLDRYDGTRFRVFQSNTKDTTSLISDFVDNLYEDGEGNIWVQQETMHCVYNPKTERFIRDLTPWAQRAGVEGSIEKIYIDTRKNFWIKAWSGDLFYYNPKTGKKSTLPMKKEKNGLGFDIVITSFADYGKNTLVSTNKGDLICYDGEKGRMSWISQHVANVRQKSDINYRIYIDRFGNYWLTGGGRCYIYIHKQKRWYDSLPEFLKAKGIANLPEDLITWDVMEDLEGRMWVATDHAGLFVVDFDKKEIYNYTHEKANDTSISDISIVKLYRDPDGQMWIGTYTGGVNQVVTNKANIRYAIIGSVNTITEDHDGNYWLGTNEKGIVRYDPSTGKTQTFDMANSGFSSNVIVASLCASDGTLWFGTYGGGLIRYANGKFINMRKGDKPGCIADDNVWAVVESPDKNIWIGTLGAGVQCIDSRTGSITTYDQNNSHLSSNYVSSMQMTDEGWIVVGTSNNYSLIDPKTRKVVNMKLDQDATRMTAVTASNTQVMMDSRGLVWYCSAAGVHVFDNATGRVTLLDQESGLAGNGVCAVIEDSKHNIWVTTEYGVSYIVLTNREGQWRFDIRNYNSLDGLLQGPYNQRSMCLTHDGLVLVGAITGFDIIDPDRLSRQVITGRPVFSGFLLYGQQIEVGKEYDGHVILPEALNESRKLTLRYDENQFSIQMASDQGIIGNRSQYVYLLEGFSNKWMKTEAGNPNISLTGLAPGNYTLVVKLLDERNQMGLEESRLEIVIKPPFWNTWWAYLIYIAIAITFIRMWHQHAIRKLRLEKMKMEAKEENRKRMDAVDAYNNMTDELRESFDTILTQIDGLMSVESNEHKYEQQQELLGNVESLMSTVNDKLSNVTSVEGKSDYIEPKITEMHIVSLDQRLVDAATAYVESNLSNSDITVETMSETLNMSRVHLYKRLTAITGMTPSEFIRDLRLRHAEQLILKSQLSVSEISYKVGFNNPRSFSKYFKEKYGEIPSQYKKTEMP